MESKSVETPVTASLLTFVGPSKNLVDCSGAGGTCSVKWRFAEPGRACKAYLHAGFLVQLDKQELQAARPDLKAVSTWPTEVGFMSVCI